MSDAVSQITTNHARRHSHANRNKKRCSNCGSFIALPDGETGQVRTQCAVCGRWQLKYAPEKEAVTSD